MADGDDGRLADLRAGRELYINKCSGCHALKSVDLYDDATWTSEVLEMVAKKKVRLTEADRTQLLRYLTTANGRESRADYSRFFILPSFPILRPCRSFGRWRICRRFWSGSASRPHSR